MAAAFDHQVFDAAYAGPVDLPDLSGPEPLESRQVMWRDGLARHLYGPIPGGPDRIVVTQHALPGEDATRLRIAMAVEDRRFEVDAALWLPRDRDCPVPLICGLDFLGPIGLLAGDAFPLDPGARVHSRPEFGVRDGRLDDVLRGTGAHRWPVGLMLDAGYGVLVSCYGSWVPDDAVAWNTHGVAPLLGEARSPANVRAISLWAWSILRLMDVAGTLEDIDTGFVAVAGHSRLGKAALWAAANDPRISAVFANASGCGGAAPARHAVGETLRQMEAAFPHWILPQRDEAQDPAFDQHQLLASIAPRTLYLGSAEDDLWADPVGSYLALVAASAQWPGKGLAEMDWPRPRQMWEGARAISRWPLGHHLRSGGHDLLPHDWSQFLRFLERRQGPEAP
jgi:(4-O-methyl)-D-glucuronate---lignin esterase